MQENYKYRTFSPEMYLNFIKPLLNFSLASNNNTTTTYPLNYHVSLTDILKVADT